jgi:hypothetical protein
VLGSERALFAVADHDDAVGADTAGQEIAHGRFRPPLAERLVVFIRAALFAMPLDEEQMLRVRLEPR